MIGAAVGLLAAELRLVLDRGRERIRLINVVLFHQLETLHTLRRQDIEGAIDDLSRELARRYGVAAESIRDQWFHSAEFREPLVTALKASVDAGLPAQYEAAVARLAEAEPVLAYRLRGRPALVGFRGHMADYLQAVERLQALSPADAAVIRSLQPFMSRVAVDEAGDALKADIRSVSELLRRRHRTEALEALERADRPLSSADHTDFRSLLARAERLVAERCQ